MPHAEVHQFISLHRQELERSGASKPLHIRIQVAPQEQKNI